MEVSTRGRYGVRAMLRLALLSRGGAILIPLRIVAEMEDISLQYLEQLFLELKKAGLVRSVRGANGGYSLNRRPEEIRVGDIVRVLEGPLAPVACVITDSPAECRRTGDCVARKIWAEVHKSVSCVLDGMTLASVLEQEAGIDLFR